LKEEDLGFAYEDFTGKIVNVGKAILNEEHYATL